MKTTTLVLLTAAALLIPARAAFAFVYTSCNGDPIAWSSDPDLCIVPIIDV
jgi:hypothetical protein